MAADTVIDRKALELSAGRRGLSLTALAAEAGISSNTLAKINRGAPVSPGVARVLDEALSRIPQLAHVQMGEA